MNVRKSKLTLAVVGAALVAGMYSLPAAADGDITVTPHGHRVVAAPDPLHGPAPIVTGPVAIAGTIVAFPFRTVEMVFPPNANDPRVVVGAPVHVAGQIAGLPFWAVNSAFGVPSTFYN